ncbi:MAG: LamG-like jellyroll fold domain-containing protein [Planctomycetaceae bacterium]
MSIQCGNEPEDDRLIRRQLDDQLSKEEFCAFNARLKNDPAFRVRYVKLSHMESQLYEHCGTAPQAKPVHVSGRNWPLMTIIVLSACIALLLILQAQNVRLNRADHDTVGTIPDEPPFYKPDRFDAPSVAVVVSVSGDVHPSLRTGQRIGPGILEFDTGVVHLEFFNGARVAIEGPANLRVESSQKATLLFGRVATYVPPRARGFVLNAPGAAIVDLGTEFEINVNDHSVTEVAVSNGEIELSMLGDDGNTLVSQRLVESGAVRLNGLNGEVQNISFDKSHTALQARYLPEPPLHVSLQYVNDVISLGPEIYWRFEQQDALTVLNEIDGGVQATVTNKSEPESLVIRDGNIRFRRDQRRSRYVLTDRPIDGLGRGPMTLELWMRPDDLQHSTCLGLIHDDPDPGRNHLSVLEVATDTFLVHEPGAIRFLVRSPPAHDFALGVNAFTPGLVTPGQWQHVVAVWDTGKIQLYFNGMAAGHVEVEQENCEGRFHVILGQLRMSTNTHRPFSGALDEVALYRRALTSDDVQRHFELIRTQNPDTTQQTTLPGDGQ